MSLPTSVRLIEVGPRDGFQMEQEFIPTEFKVSVIERLAAAGLPEIEATSFVHPRVIPQTRDAKEVMQTIERPGGTRWSVLVPNLKGAERALEVGVDEVRLVICSTESYNQRNVGLTIQESIDRFGEIVELTSAHDVDASVVFGVSLGCPIEGKVPIPHVVEIVRRVVERGAAAVGIADSYGVANPAHVRDAVRAVQDVLDGLPLWMHLHDTRGQGMANVFVALDQGVDRFDTGFGGLGGTPIMKGASGNIATEDMVYFCEEMGIATGVDLEAVRVVSRDMERHLGRKLPSKVLQVGTHEELIELNRKAFADAGGVDRGGR